MIRITVAETALQTGVGLARIDGQADPVSIDTARRLLCTGKVLRVGFDPTGRYIEQSADPQDHHLDGPTHRQDHHIDGPTHPQDHQIDGPSSGHHDGARNDPGDDPGTGPAADHRLYTAKQREILAAKFGGCMDPDCDRPPSWCEAHHIRFVVRDGGKTTIINGILLCRYHHLKYHNDGYEIVLDDHGNYWKIPPATLDPDQTPIPMPLKTRNLHDLWSAAS